MQDRSDDKVGGFFARHLAGQPLPPGWMLFHHATGMPCYQHLATKICTWYKPYSLPEESTAAQHTVPSAIRLAVERFAPRLPKRQRLDQSAAAFSAALTSAPTCDHPPQVNDPACHH